jgi:hypothetical protein
MNTEILNPCPACAAEAASARRRPGHPRLFRCNGIKTWMPGTRPGMTNAEMRVFAVGI